MEVDTRSGYERDKPLPVSKSGWTRPAVIAVLLQTLAVVLQAVHLVSNPRDWHAWGILFLFLMAIGAIVHEARSKRRAQRSAGSRGDSTSS